VVKDFERWPSQQAVAARGDAQYAYSTYQSLASNLAVLGFNMNFGPSLLPASKGQQSNSFGSNPLQAGVFAKTFILGHRDLGVLPVPIIDDSDLAIRALKTLLVSYPETPVAFTPGRQEQIPFVQSSGIVKGARFCFISVEGGQEEGRPAQYFNQGCDILVLKAGAESPASARERVAQAVSDAIAKGELSLEQLTLSAHRLSALRSSIAARNDEHAIKTAHAH
jgi:beta-glucosidase-like glycosyl hydrolase